MPAPPRILLPGTVVFVTSRTEEGLPFVCAEYMNLVLRSALARAQSLYPVTISHFIVMANHIHLLMVVKNPEDIRDFMDRFKTETAHAVNRLMGRRKRTIWGDSYDCVPVLTPDDVLEKIAYLYNNPSASNLVDSIEEYPGVSSWRMWREKRGAVRTPWIRRVFVSPLKGPVLSSADQKRVLTALKAKSKQEHTLRIDPNAWMNVFEITERREYHERLLRRIQEQEMFLREKRDKSRTRCFGAQRLIHQPINKIYQPKKFGKRMWCICSDVALRKSFIGFIKELRALGRFVLSKWRIGDLSERYPLGLFPPTFPRLGNLIPQIYA